MVWICRGCGRNIRQWRRGSGHTSSRDTRQSSQVGAPAVSCMYRKFYSFFFYKGKDQSQRLCFTHPSLFVLSGIQDLVSTRRGQQHQRKSRRNEGRVCWRGPCRHRYLQLFSTYMTEFRSNRDDSTETLPISGFSHEHEMYLFGIIWIRLKADCAYRCTENDL